MKGKCFLYLESDVGSGQQFTSPFAAELPKQTQASFGDNCL